MPVTYYRSYGFLKLPLFDISSDNTITFRCMKFSSLDIFELISATADSNEDASKVITSMSSLFSPPRHRFRRHLHHPG